MATAGQPPRGRSAAVSRRLLLAGALGTCCAAALSKLPAAQAGARSGVRPDIVRPTVAAPFASRVPEEAAEAPPETAPPPTYDIVLHGGRVIDPETGFDRLADVGIDGATIAAIDTEALAGRTVIDVSGLVVAPGFIDLLSYDPNPYGEVFKVADGVTTNLCMHGINSEPGPWFESWEASPTLVHRGGAFDHAWARAQLGLDIRAAASAAQVDALAAAAAAAVAAGFLGVHLELEYTPGVGHDEVVAMGRVAAAAGVRAWFHARHADPHPPGTNAEALAELLDVARETGCAVHVEHLTSTGGTRTMEASLGAMQAARDEGIDVSGCLYPYDFWAAYAASTRFDAGWQERFGISHQDLVVPGTGAVLTRHTFRRARRSNTLVAARAIPEEDVRSGLRSDLLVLGSDAILEPGDNNHPRAAGTFARTLGRYVREEQVLDLHSALAKMTVGPARLLQGAAPAMARKGRLQVGADADVTVFDPATVADRATVEDPAQASVGVAWVLVDGAVVKDPEGVRTDVRVGRSIRTGDL